MAAASVVWNGFMVAPQTAIRQIESLMPGEFRAYDTRGNEKERETYWHPSPPIVEKVAPIDEDELAKVLQECVRVHLASDVPLGCLSIGGCRFVGGRQPCAEERRESRQYLYVEFRRSGVQRRGDRPACRRSDRYPASGAARLTETHFIGRLDAALDSLDQPTFDGLNSYYMSHAVREAGYKVALVGSGGDELFGGYTSFRDLPRFMHWYQAAKWLPAQLGAWPWAGSLLRRFNHLEGGFRRKLAGQSCRTCWRAAMTRRCPVPVGLMRSSSLHSQRQLLGGQWRRLKAALKVDGLPPAMDASSSCRNSNSSGCSVRYC